MCGFAGFLSPSAGANDSLILRKMTDAIRERGPDGEGQWIETASGVALGHRRLAVVDLSGAGSQPMISASGRYVITYNGELYNHRAIRAELEASGAGLTWRGHSDTETLLAGVERWGLAATLRRMTGMFGFALWDRHRRELHLARDRMGEKPVYYGWQGKVGGGAFLFGSDLKALSQHPSFAHQVNPAGLTSLLRYGYVGDSLSIFSGISKLGPGTIATVSLKAPSPSIQRYWDFSQVARESIGKPLSISAEESATELEKLLRQAISLQMEADVPVGAFLSGGVDSSTIVALMQALARERGLESVRTFTVGFEDREFDEAPFASAVARHLGTNHTERYVTGDDALRVISKLPSMYGEPFADSSQIPTFLLSETCRSSVTVALSGDGGDELFCGYSRYLAGQKLLSLLNALPSWARSIGASLLAKASAEEMSDIYNRARRVLPRSLHITNVSSKIEKLRRALSAGPRSREELYDLLVCQWPNAEEVVSGGALPKRETDEFAFSVADDFQTQMMLADATAYLPDDILCKVDRAAMAVSLETRVPLLDHQVVAYSLNMPLAHKLKDGLSKSPLRRILYQYVPRELIERPKRGFGVPLDAWLRGPLRDWAEDLLSEQRLRAEGHFNEKIVRKTMERHMSGQSNESSKLWCVLMFQAWHTEYRAKWGHMLGPQTENV